MRQITLQSQWMIVQQVSYELIMQLILGGEEGAYKGKVYKCPIVQLLTYSFLKCVNKIAKKAGVGPDFNNVMKPSHGFLFFCADNFYLIFALCNW